MNTSQNEEDETASSIFISFQDELLKLLLIVEQNFKKGNDLTAPYILEKLTRAYNKTPIVLHPSLEKIYKQIKKEYIKLNTLNL